jgi:hypothetical protein
VLICEQLWLLAAYVELFLRWIFLLFAWYEPLRMEIEIENVKVVEEERRKEIDML